MKRRRTGTTRILRVADPHGRAALLRGRILGQRASCALRQRRDRNRLCPGATLAATLDGDTATATYTKGDTVYAKMKLTLNTKL